MFSPTPCSVHIDAREQKTRKNIFHWSFTPVYYCEHKFTEGKNGGGYLRAQEKRESYTLLLFLLTCTQGLVMCWQTDSMDCNLCVVRCAYMCM